MAGNGRGASRPFRAVVRASLGVSGSACDRGRAAMSLAPFGTSGGGGRGEALAVHLHRQPVDAEGVRDQIQQLPAMAD